MAWLQGDIRFVGLSLVIETDGQVLKFWILYLWGLSLIVYIYTHEIFGILIFTEYTKYYFSLLALTVIGYMTNKYAAQFTRFKYKVFLQLSALSKTISHVSLLISTTGVKS